MEIPKQIFECVALSILGGLARLFLLEKTLIGGWKQFFGGMVFGSLIGYLFSTMNVRQELYLYTGKIWRLWAVTGAIFGREILRICKAIIMKAVPVFGRFLMNQANRFSAAYRAYNSYKDEDD